jgi:hypothetical protein
MRNYKKALGWALLIGLWIALGLRLTLFSDLSYRGVLSFIDYVFYLPAMRITTFLLPRALDPWNYFICLAILVFGISVLIYNFLIKES